MRSPELLQMLKSGVEMKAQIEESETYVSQIVGDDKACAARFTMPVENSKEVFEVIVRKVATHTGLQEQHAG